MVKAKKAVRIWILTGLVMSLVQVMIGGVTRLTDSGLSITEWDVLMGTLPPMSTESWNEAFESYQEIGQYKHLNEGMSLGEFKMIFFWEYFHRLWARLIGLVFIIPFIFFIATKKLNRKWIMRLTFAMLLGAAQALMGWIMVKSGLTDDKLYVSPIKLTLHLVLALALVVYLYWLYLELRHEKSRSFQILKPKVLRLLMFLALLQVCLGGFVAGMKAGMVYNDWPAMGGKVIPEVLTNSNSWTADAMVFDERHVAAQALVQWTHRGVAYLILILVSVFTFKILRVGVEDIRELKASLWIGLFLIFQVALGVIFLLVARSHSGQLPVFWGVAHQLMAFFLFLAMFLPYYRQVDNRSVANS